MKGRFDLSLELGKVLLFQRHDPFSVEIQRLFENCGDGADGDILFRIDLEDLHSAPASFDEQRMVESFSFYETEIRSAVLLIDPEITEHFSAITEERHAVFPCLRNILILPQHDITQCKKCTLLRLNGAEIEIIQIAGHYFSERMDPSADGSALYEK